MNTKLDSKYIEHVAALEIKSVYSYRIFLMLLVKEYTQAQLTELLGLKKQSTFKYVQELLSLKLIEETRTEGRNKFLGAVTDMKRLSGVIPGQESW